jgi:hypothetical protein
MSDVWDVDEVCEILDAGEVGESARGGGAGLMDVDASSWGGEAEGSETMRYPETQCLVMIVEGVRVEVVFVDGDRPGAEELQKQIAGQMLEHARGLGESMGAVVVHRGSVVGAGGVVAKWEVEAAANSRRARMQTMRAELVVRSARMQTMMAELVALEADVTRRQWKLAMMEEGLSLDHEPWEEDVYASGAADSEATPAGGGEDTYDSQVVGTLESPSSGRIPSTRGAAAIFVEAPIDPGAAAIFVEDSIDPGAAAIFVEAPIDLGAAASMVEAPIYLGAAAIQACANYEDCAEYFNMQKASNSPKEAPIDLGAAASMPIDLGAAASMVEDPIYPGAAAIMVEDSIDPGAEAIMVEDSINPGAIAQDDSRTVANTVLESSSGWWLR